MGGTRAGQPEPAASVRTAGDQPRQPLLPSGGRRGGKPGVDAVAGRAVHALPLLREPTPDGLVTGPRVGGQSQAGGAADGGDGAGGPVPQATAESAGGGA